MQMLLPLQLFPNLLIWQLFRFCHAQIDGERDFYNYFVEPPAAESALNSRPGVFGNNKVYLEGTPVAVEWQTEHNYVDIGLVKEDNNTGSNLFQIICTQVSVWYCYWNGAIPDRLKQTYVWPNNVYYFIAFVPGDSVNFMASHYINVTNATINIIPSLSSTTAISAASDLSTSTIRNSTSSTVSPSSMSVIPNGTSKTALAGGLGGGLGGLAVLVAITAPWMWIRKRRHLADSHMDSTQHEHQSLPASTSTFDAMRTPNYLHSSSTHSDKPVSNPDSTSRFSELPGSHL